VAQASLGVESFNDLDDHDFAVKNVVLRGKKTPDPRSGAERFVVR
jgi:hypothetical protein